MKRLDILRQQTHESDIQTAIFDAISRKYPLGLTRTGISSALNRNVSSDDIADALERLIAAGKIRGVYQRNGRRGRPREVWYKQ